MNRYIDVDALEEKAKQYSLGYYEADEWAVPLCEISEVPSIDIVFCKECKHYKIFDNGYECEMGLYNVAVNDFCSYGEREGE